MEATRFVINGVGSYALTGTLDARNAKTVLLEGQKHWAGLSAGIPIRIDLSQLGRSDSAALAVFVGWKRWAREHGRRLSYLGAPPDLVALARLSGIADLFAPMPEQVETASAHAVDRPEQRDGHHQ